MTNGESEPTYDRRRLLSAYASFVGAGRPEKGRAAAWYRALASAFGVDLEEHRAKPAGPRPEWMDLSRWQDASSAWGSGPDEGGEELLRSAARACAQFATPFDEYLEAPPVIVAYRAQFEPGLRASVADARELQLDLMEAPLMHYWGLDRDAVVSEAQVRAARWRPEDWPDPDEIF